MLNSNKSKHLPTGYLTPQESYKSHSSSTKGLVLDSIPESQAVEYRGKVLDKYFIVLVVIVGFLFGHPSAKAFEFAFGDKKFTVDEQDLNSWEGAGAMPQTALIEKHPDPYPVVSAYLGKKSTSLKDAVIFKYRPEKIYAYLKTLEKDTNAIKAEPVLEISAQDQVLNFSPPRDGLILDIYGSTLKTLKALESSANSAELAVEIDKPVKSLTQTNNLGINELIAVGQSNFKGSPKNRIHNIKVGISKFKGALIKPNEEFSFNKLLGPVEKDQGFLPELVIKREGTVPELGGGLCQVSSTTFRAAMNAGLPITARKNHAYAVQYYSPQGTDATIYPGSVDLKFINDTPGYLLVWPYIKDNHTLVFEFYGTKDGRKVTLQKPIQYDRKADGSMKATWTRIVEKDGEISTSTFKSIYQSPALFHKEEKFVTATGTPSSGLQVPKTN